MAYVAEALMALAVDQGATWEFSLTGEPTDAAGYAQLVTWIGISPPVDWASVQAKQAVLDALAPWDALRATRDSMLAASDFHMLGDSPPSDTSAWATYRQSLRDLPANTADPVAATWPTAPSS